MSRARVAVLGTIAILLVGGSYALLRNRNRAPEEKSSAWHPTPQKFGTRQVTVFDSGTPGHRQYLDCTGCLRQLTELQHALNVQVGLGAIVDGGYVSTPAPSYYLDGGIALLPDGAYFAPTIDEEIPHAHPTVAGRYHFAVLDKDYHVVMALLDAGVSDGALPEPVPSLDDSWATAVPQ